MCPFYEYYRIFVSEETVLFFSKDLPGVSGRREFPSGTDTIIYFTYFTSLFFFFCKQIFSLPK